MPGHSRTQQTAAQYGLYDAVIRPGGAGVRDQIEVELSKLKGTCSILFSASSTIRPGLTGPGGVGSSEFKTQVLFVGWRRDGASGITILLPPMQNPINRAIAT